jgi:hypothetical protein
MIVFDLECSGGHRFEGWFHNTGSFEEQVNRNLVTCPACGDSRIKRILSPVTTCGFRSDQEKSVEPLPIDYRKLAAEIVEYINTRFEDVGPQFTKEALKMHYGVTEKKKYPGLGDGGRGKDLATGKIEFFKIPFA